MEERESVPRVFRGAWVVIDYRVRLKGGKIVDSSEKSGGPRAFVCGAGDFPPPVEEGVLGMAPGEKKVIQVPPEFAYGPYDPKKVCLVASERIQEEPAPGKVVKAPDEFGMRRPAVVRAVWHGAVLLDFNHPLAGQVLHFEVEIREVRPCPPGEEKACGTRAPGGEAG